MNLWNKATHSIKQSALLLLLIVSMLIGGCSTELFDLEQKQLNSSNSQSSVEKSANQADSTNKSQTEPESPLTSFDEVAQYIRNYGELPDNYITKKEAEKLGWIASEGNLQEVAPGMSIGGDRFGNREGLLPKANGRTWYEADINYEGGRRNADRIVFSNDGLIYMTTDHYKSFTDITKEE